jgi:hypothetical protein
MSNLEALKSRLIDIDTEKSLIVKELCMHFKAGELILYKSNPNPNIDAMQLGRIIEVLPWGLNVERYKPDGSKMKGEGHVIGSNMASVVKVPHLDVDNM